MYVEHMLHSSQHYSEHLASSPGSKVNACAEEGELGDEASEHPLDVYTYPHEIRTPLIRPLSSVPSVS